MSTPSSVYLFGSRLAVLGPFGLWRRWRAKRKRSPLPGLNAVEQDVAFRLEQNLWKQIREAQE